MLIRIIPVGNIPEKVLESVKAALPDIFNAEVRVLGQHAIPSESYNNWRKQYDAEKIISILTQEKDAQFIDKDIPTLLIADKDLYYDGMNFVFGIEDMTKGCAIISIARLKPEFYKNATNMTVLTERVIKEAVHEIGHHLGLEHCKHPFCVMCFSPSIEDVDNKQKYFCNGCKLKASTKGINLD
ncbi:MAG: archaemetzincin family Zn-dependent metalloprotease [Candidatus Aenigmatarchaeota archaeon]